MEYALVFLLGVIAGGTSLFGIFAARRSSLNAQKRQQDAQEERIQEILKGRAWFETQVVSYKELQNENAILKHDLQNVDVNVRKLELDRQLQREAHEKLEQLCGDLGS